MSFVGFFFCFTGQVSCTWCTGPGTGRNYGISWHCKLIASQQVLPCKVYQQKGTFWEMAIHWNSTWALCDPQLSPPSTVPIRAKSRPQEFSPVTINGHTQLPASLACAKLWWLIWEGAWKRLRVPGIKNCIHSFQDKIIILHFSWAYGKLFAHLALSTCEIFHLHHPLIRTLCAALSLYRSAAPKGSGTFPVPLIDHRNRFIVSFGLGNQLMY